jgi:hypothetical protein
VSTPYAGNLIFPATITVLEDSDLKDAQSVAVALEQLADRTAYLNGIITGGVDLSFTDATFHGVTNFADGSLNGTLDNPSSLTFGHFFHVTIADNGSFVSAMALQLGGDTIEMNAGTSFDLFAFGTSMSMGGAAATLNADNIALNGGLGVTLNVGATHGVQVTGAIASSYFDCFGGRFNVTAGPGAGSCEIAVGSVLLGDGAAATVTVPGTLFASGAVNIGGAVGIVGGLNVTGGKVRLPTIVPAFSLGMSIDPNSCYEVVFSNTMTSDTTVSCTHSFITIGHRIRFNAQNVTGPYTYYLQTGDGREWAMRNAATPGLTVVIELVSNGTQWVVDDWAQGGGARNGI